MVLITTPTIMKFRRKPRNKIDYIYYGHLGKIDHLSFNLYAYKYKDCFISAWADIAIPTCILRLGQNYPHHLTMHVIQGIILNVSDTRVLVVANTNFSHIYKAISL